MEHTERMKLSDADRVWNRAASQGGGEFARAGDEALTALLRFHGLAMNGGVHHALEVLDDADLEAAIRGYEYFGMAKVAAFLSLTDTPPLAEWTDESEVLANRYYMQMVPDDECLARRFEVSFDRCPKEYSPLCAGDGLV